jgi:hypothetical protein
MGLSRSRRGERQWRRVIGRRIFHVYVIRPLGAGGMGVVYALTPHHKKRLEQNRLTL